VAACRSSAPYTIPAAAINTAIAASSSAVQRSQGGCYATCTGNTVCNPTTGFCEPFVIGCPPGEPTTSPCSTNPDMATTRAAPSGGAGLPVGVSPATGSVPPPPAESSPKFP